MMCYYDALYENTTITRAVQTRNDSGNMCRATIDDRGRVICFIFHKQTTVFGTLQDDKLSAGSRSIIGEGEEEEKKNNRLNFFLPSVRDSRPKTNRVHVHFAESEDV